MFDITQTLRRREACSIRWIWLPTTTSLETVECYPFSECWIPIRVAVFFSFFFLDGKYFVEVFHRSRPHGRQQESRGPRGKPARLGAFRASCGSINSIRGVAYLTLNPRWRTRLVTILLDPENVHPPPLLPGRPLAPPPPPRCVLINVRCRFGNS